MKLFSNKLKHVRSDIRGPLYLEALRMQADGIPVLRLNTGNPGAFEFKMPDSIREGLLQNLDRAVPYSDVKGLPDARQAICDYHLRKGFVGVTPEDVFIGNGVSEIASLVLTALLDPGDEVLMPTPCYSLWSNDTWLNDAVPVFYRCDEASNWFPDVADIRAKITPRTHAIVLINPNNPTGVLYSRQVLMDILQVAREYDLIVIADEIYDRLIMDGKHHDSVAVLAPDLTVVTTNGLSKSHIICGFRCGWLILSGPEKNKKAIESALMQVAAIRLCSNTLSQLVIPYALNDPESTQAMLVPGGRLYEQRAAALDELSKIEGITCVPNDAAFYIFPRFDPQRFHVQDDHEFALDLLHKKHILIIPGSGFEWEQPDHFRVVMLPKPDQLREACRQIGDYLRSRE